MNIELQVPEELDGTAPEQAEDEFDGNTDDDIYEDDDEYSDEEESEYDSDEDDSEDGRQDTSRTSRPGIDKVLRDVQESLSPEHAEVIRGLQRDFVQSNQVESMRNQLRDALTEVEQLRDSLLNGDNPEGDEREELLSTVPPEQIALL